MHSILETMMQDQHTLVLLGIVAVSIAALGWSADWLVEEAVAISLRSGVPRVIVGATAVSVGTTTPEAAVSVLAAFAGKPEVALGNAVGSIICDTGLILGLACLIAPLPFHRKLVNRQGWVQFGAGVLLIAACIPWAAPMSAFAGKAVLPQWAGWIFVALLFVYIGWSIRQAKSGESDVQEGLHYDVQRSLPATYARLALAVVVVVASSTVLIAAATELATQMNVPKGVIAATLIAFGTSLPELIIAVTAVRKGQGDLAIGNVIGADILNVLFVAGAAASVTPQGLAADAHFFKIQFPGMLFLLLVFRLGIWRSTNDRLARPFGLVLLAAYLGVTILSYLTNSTAH